MEEENYLVSLQSASPGRWNWKKEEPHCLFGANDPSRLTLSMKWAAFPTDHSFWDIL